MSFETRNTHAISIFSAQPNGVACDIIDRASVVTSSQIVSKCITTFNDIINDTQIAQQANAFAKRIMYADLGRNLF